MLPSPAATAEAEAVQSGGGAGPSSGQRAWDLPLPVLLQSSGNGTVGAVSAATAERLLAETGAPFEVSAEVA